MIFIYLGGTRSVARGTTLKLLKHAESNNTKWKPTSDVEMKVLRFIKKTGSLFQSHFTNPIFFDIGEIRCSILFYQKFLEYIHLNVQNNC